MTSRAAAFLPNGSETLAAWFVLLGACVVAAALYIAWPSDLGIKIAGMALVVAVACGVVRCDISHPYVWFGGAMLLYSISGPLLIHLQVHPYVVWGGSEVASLDFSGAMDLQFLGLVTALLVIGPGRRPLHAAATSAELQPFFRGALVVCILGAAAGSVSVYEIFSQGFTERTQYSVEGGALSRFSFGFNILATATGIYVAKLLHEKRITAAMGCGLLAVLVGILLVGMIGQRHFLFRVGIVMLFTWHLFHRPIPMRLLILLAFGALLAGSALSGYKMWLTVESSGLGSGGFLETLQNTLALRNPELMQDPAWLRYTKVALAAALGTEAMTPGNNMAMILSRFPHDIPFLAGSTIPSDVARAVLPGFAVSNVLDSTGALYNELVFPENTAQGGGVGFTIVGYGYIHFGTPGVVATMALLGLAIRWIYAFASRSAFGLCFFIGFVPVGVYIARNDLTAPLSQGIKHVLLPLVLMFVVSVLLGYRGPVRDRRNAADRRLVQGLPSLHADRERRSAADRRNGGNRRQGPRAGHLDRAPSPT